MNPWVTILISTSPVDSNPSIDTITDVITKMREQLPDAPVIVMCDGIYDNLRFPDQQMFERNEGASEELFRTRAENYEEYKRNLFPWCRENDVVTVEFSSHTHRANMTRECLKHVKTPCVLPIDHDTYIFNVDWQGIERAMTNPQVNSIRLYNFEKIHPAHAHLVRPVEMVDGVPLMRTIQYGDHPNIQRTDFLRHIIQTYIGKGTKSFVEGVLWQVCHNDGWDGQYFLHKLFLYAPENMKCFEDANIRNNIPTPDPVYENPL